LKSPAAPVSPLSMRVEVWSDIICPWCGLGNHRLEQALARFPHAQDVEVVYRSFQLDPSAPAVPETAREMLRKKYGASPQQLDAMTGRVEAMARADGLEPYHVGDNLVANTRLAHAFALWAREQGKGREAWRALYKSYFGEKRSVFDVDALVALAPKLGLSADACREALRSGRYDDLVREEQREATEMGASGVPFFVIDRKFAVEGAQSTDVLLRALEVAWKEAASARE
jgi:predicted DsbA family dithiol-disulfide isomerase